ncbi:MAG: hypothetical protein ACT4QG_08240 [Sporichthyaceae bacterium]
MEEDPYQIVAFRGRDGGMSAQVRYRGFSESARTPVAPEHLYRPGSGRTLCDLVVDESWERFPEQGGVLTGAGCSACGTAQSVELVRRREAAEESERSWAGRVNLHRVR